MEYDRLQQSVSNRTNFLGGRSKVTETVKQYVEAFATQVRTHLLGTGLTVTLAEDQMGFTVSGDLYPADLTYSFAPGYSQEQGRWTLHVEHTGYERYTDTTELGPIPVSFQGMYLEQLQQSMKPLLPVFEEFIGRTFERLERVS